MDASSIAADLQHVQKFLMDQAAVLGHSGKQVTQGQHFSFMSRISRLSHLNAESASLLTGTVQAGPWDADQKSQLCSAIAMKLTTHADSRTPGSTSRRANQEIRTFYNYLTSDDKAVIEDAASTASSKLSAVCQRALMLGLDIPSETSMRHVVAVVCGLGYTNADTDPEALFGFVAEFKRWMKIWKPKALAPPSAEFMAQYPESPKQLPPSIYSHAYKHGEPWVCSDAMISAITVIESRVPLRRSSKLVRPNPLPTPSQAIPEGLMHVMQQIYSRGMPQWPQQQQCQIQFLAPRQHSSSVLPALPPAPEPLPHTVSHVPLPMPLPDQTASTPQTIEPENEKMPAPTDEQPSLDVKGQMEAFLDAHAQRTEIRNLEKKRLEDATATSEQATPKKKPTKGVKGSSKKASPTAVAKKARKPWHVTVEKAVGKQRWLASKNGCGKCRYAPFCTPSCWRLRGVNV